MVNTPTAAKIFIALLLVCLSAQLSLAQESWDSVPLPAPTNAVEEGLKTLKVEGVVPASQGELQSTKAASLVAQGRLLEASLEAKVFAGAWKQNATGHRHYRIGEDFGNTDQLSWLMQSRQLGTSADKKTRTVLLESAKKSDVQASRSNLRSLSPSTVSGKQVAVGFDGSLYVLLPQTDGTSTIVYRSASYGSFQSVSGEGYQRYFSRVPMYIKSVTSGGQDMAKVELVSEITEVVNGKLLGNAQQEQVIYVPTTKTSQITFSDMEPGDFSTQSTDPMSLKGRVQSHLLLDSVQLQHNGEVVWAVSERMRQKLRSLDFELTRPLSKGWSLLRYSARDAEGALQNRDLWVHSAKGPATAPQGLKRAVVVTTGGRSWPRTLQNQLRNSGFRDSMISVLNPKDITADALLSTIRDGRQAGQLFLYLEAPAVSSPGAEGKKLKFSDRALGATEIAQSLTAGGYKQVVGLLHMSDDRKSRRVDGTDWLEKTVFLERLADGGRLFATLTSPSARRSRRARSLSRNFLKSGLESSQGDMLGGWFSRPEADRLILRGWLYGGS